MHVLWYGNALARNPGIVVASMVIIGVLEYRFTVMVLYYSGSIYVA